jgi:hypothetical protein
VVSQDVELGGRARTTDCARKDDEDDDDHSHDAEVSCIRRLPALTSNLALTAPLRRLAGCSSTNNSTDDSPLRRLQDCTSTADPCTV